MVSEKINQINGGTCGCHIDTGALAGTLTAVHATVTFPVGPDNTETQFELQIPATRKGAHQPRRKPAAESGRAALYTDSRAKVFFTKSAGTSRTKTTANWVTSDVPWNTLSGMGCIMATCSMKPAMNARTDVLNTGRHRMRHAREKDSFS